MRPNAAGSSIIALVLACLRSRLYGSTVLWPENTRQLSMHSLLAPTHRLKLLLRDTTGSPPGRRRASVSAPRPVPFDHIDAGTRDSPRTPTSPNGKCFAVL